MGYESRVYIVHEWNTCVYVEGEKPLAETIATFDLCCVENGFLDVFKSEAKYYLYESHDGEDIIIKEDKYGKPLTSANIMDVYNAIEYGKYWRTTMLKEALHAIIANRDILSRGFDDLKVYHYGY